MNAGGLSRQLVELGLSLVGHLRGGLGYVAVITAILLASLSGSAVADTAVLAAMLIPIMRNAGYDVGRSAGLMAAGGIIAPVIPPSIGFIVFGVAGSVSISRLFLAGIVPGVIMGLALACTWWLLTRTSDIAVLPRRTSAAVSGRSQPRQRRACTGFASDHRRRPQGRCVHPDRSGGGRRRLRTPRWRTSLPRAEA